MDKNLARLQAQFWPDIEDRFLSVAMPEGGRKKSAFAEGPVGIIPIVLVAEKSRKCGIFKQSAPTGIFMLALTLGLVSIKSKVSNRQAGSGIAPLGLIPAFAA